MYPAAPPCSKTGCVPPSLPVDQPGPPGRGAARLSVGTTGGGRRKCRPPGALGACGLPLAELFPRELQAAGGVIESPLAPAPAPPGPGLGAAEGALGQVRPPAARGRIDQERGGIHEVLESGWKRWRYSMAWWRRRWTARWPSLKARTARLLPGGRSTGNLGLSIGVAASALFSRRRVHASADAKAWARRN